MAFNKTKLIKLSKALDLNIDKLQLMLFKQAKYLKTDANKLLKSFCILEQLQQEQEQEQAKKLEEKSMYKTKNIIIAKYMEKILKLYRLGYGSIKISKQLKIDHNATISKSGIDSFIKTNGIKRNG